MVATDKRLMTAEKLLTMPADDMRHELVEGVLTTMPPAGHEHGYLADKLSRRIWAFDPEAKLGQTLSSDTGFKLANDPDTVRAPDLAFVSAGRLSGPPGKGYLPLAPDLAVEVLSPSNTRVDMNRKVNDYLKAGGSLVWVVDPVARTITVWSAGDATQILHEGDVLDGGKVLPGFSCLVGDLFP